MTCLVTSHMISHAFACGSLMACAAVTLVATDIDYAAVGDPQSVEIADRSVEARWKALFEVEPEWISRQITYLVDRQADRAPTLLAARLLYRGEPWSRRSSDQINARRWRASDLDTRLSILREMRAQRDPAYLDVIRHFLAGEATNDLVSSALATAWLLAPKDAPDLAVRLADPRLTEHLPGAANAAVRQEALRFLIRTSGAAAAETRRALSWALLHAKSGERNHALALIDRSEASDLLKAAILRLNQERSAKVLDEEGNAGLALACVRIGQDIDPELATALVAIAVGGTREVAAPAATALASNLTWTASVPVDRIQERARTDPDPVVRGALLNLLLRVNTKAGAIAEDGSPWNALSSHRERLSRWEWEQFVR